MRRLNVFAFCLAILTLMVVATPLLAGCGLIEPPRLTVIIDPAKPPVVRPADDACPRPDGQPCR